mmetsp:Transcript_9932/g.24847  ORF Transcript_9932/g.24847 Transcript_9932/m.24847 type:complete len:272 (+) Transcript_9932:240-1055(+)
MRSGCVAAYAAVKLEKTSFLPSCRSSASRGSVISGALSPPLCLSRCCVSSVPPVVPMRPCLPMPEAIPGSGLRALDASSVSFALRLRPPRSSLYMGSACGVLMTMGGVKSKGDAMRGLRAAPIMTPRSLKVVSYSTRQPPALRLPSPTKTWFSRWCHASAVTLPGMPTLRTSVRLPLSKNTTAPASSLPPALTPVTISDSSGENSTLVVGYAHGRSPHTCTGLLNCRRSHSLSVSSMPRDTSVCPSWLKARLVISVVGACAEWMSWLGRDT